MRYIRSHGHPTTPIVLSEGTRYGSGWVNNWTGTYAEYNAALRDSYLELVAAGDRHVFYVFGADLYSNDTHAVDLDSPTAAGCHPTDVGHYRIARHYSAVLPGWMDGATNDANAAVVRAEYQVTSNVMEKKLPEHSLSADTLVWRKAQDLGPIRGIPAFPPSLPMAGPFRRFPAAAQQDFTPEMWQMATWSSGSFLRFDSNASSFAANFTLTEAYEQYETLMPIDGTSGVDLYAHDISRSQWLFVGTNVHSGSHAMTATCVAT